MRRFPSPLIPALCAAGALLGACPAVLAGAAVSPLERPALVSHRATHSVLLDVTHAGDRLVVVGERGIVLLSDDGGKAWRQAKVPVSVTLTTVRFVNDRTGWAVGHYGVVLKTEDGGESWAVQFDGKRAADLALESAKAIAAAKPDDEAAQRLLADAERLVADGPDKPFLDLFFENENAGYVVGAYNMIFRTEDGGRTWVSWMDRVENPKAVHLYAMRALNGKLYLAGEQGLFARSDDGGRSFRLVATPYTGSYFTAAGYPDGTLVIAGLRGNAFVTADEGKTWRKVEGVPPVNITTAKVVGDTLFMTNFAGQVWVSKDRGATIQPLPIPPLPPLTNLLPRQDGGLLVLSLQGLIPLPAPGAAAANQAGGH